MKDTCKDIMINSPVTLLPQTTLIDAVLTIRAKSVRYLPVVDENGFFVGIFSSVRFLASLLPQSINMNMGKLPPDLNFMRTSVEELKELLGEKSQDYVVNHITKDDVSICYPDSSIMEAINLLSSNHSHVIVTEKESAKFLGIITINGLIDLMTTQS